MGKHHFRHSSSSADVRRTFVAIVRRLSPSVFGADRRRFAARR
jgi:hypothetical protein